MCGRDSALARVQRRAVAAQREPLVIGVCERGTNAVAKRHFPGLHPDAARWLVVERTIKAVGLDTASIDYGQSTLFESHRILFEKNIPAFENVAGAQRTDAPYPPTAFCIGS